MNAVVNASVEASVAVIVGPLGTFSPYGTFVGLGGVMVDVFARPNAVVGEMATCDCEKQKKEGEVPEGERNDPVEWP